MNRKKLHAISAPCPAMTNVFWMLVKSFVEESFLRADPQYAAYTTQVRSRWIPLVI